MPFPRGISTDNSLRPDRLTCGVTLSVGPLGTSFSELKALSKQRSFHWGKCIWKSRRPAPSSRCFNRFINCRVWRVRCNVFFPNHIDYNGHIIYYKNGFIFISPCADSVHLLTYVGPSLGRPGLAGAGDSGIRPIVAHCTSRDVNSDVGNNHWSVRDCWYHGLKPSHPTVILFRVPSLSNIWKPFTG